MNINEITEKQLLLLDGAMGTMLQNRGLKLGEAPDILNITHPETVKEVHTAYLKAGSDMILTNTLGANSRKLPAQYGTAKVVEAAVKIAKDTIQDCGHGFAALDIGPIGELLAPNGTLSFDEAYEFFAEQIIVGANAGADAIYIETMIDLLEAKCAVLAAKENCNLPVFCTMTFESGGRTFLGDSIAAAMVTLDALGVDFIGINCSAGPREMLPLIREMKKWTDKPLIIKPNAGIPVIDNGRTVFNVRSEEFAGDMLEIIGEGAAVIGGCCGTTPEFIEKLSVMIQNREPVKRFNASNAVCSSSEILTTDRVRVIGERINPTGKKKFKKALSDGDFDYIVEQAAEQIRAGADILDVNIGMPGIDEAELMPKIIQKIQSVVNAPLQIDSSNFSAIEAGLRVYNGKAIVNSVNGDDEVLERVLPIVKKYGAAVIGLTLDKNGIPDTAEKRLEVAEKIVNAALSYGIKKTDVIIDCLTLTAGAEQKIAYETLEAVKLIKQKLGVKTTLGISNISFGLPARGKLNLSFLTIALSCGLDFPIMNPNDEEMMDAVYSYNLLKNIDINGSRYIERFSGCTERNVNKSNDTKSVLYCMENGLKDEIKSVVKKLLKEREPLDIVNEELIPALDIIGKNYEKSKIFLPQLLQAADAAKAAFEIVRNTLPPSSIANENTILFATVEGDIHDIGKNIVKTVLENYGYNIIDMGCNVSVKEVSDTAVNNGVKLVGLSALMTTTVKSMEKTIHEIKNRNKNIKIMVGGAVLTEDYAKKIGADYYSKDAMGAVLIAREVFGK